jgi:hypothetical protein
MYRPTNAWLVGRYMLSSGVTQTLIDHYNGTAWKIVPSPNPGGPLNGHYLAGVASVAAHDIWAVGFYDRSGTAGTGTLIERWNGTSWKVIKSPNIGAGNNFLAGVAATSAGNAWAVGSYVSGTATKTLVEHWNGTSWKVIKGPNVGAGSNILEGVSATSAGNAWAVGFSAQGAASQTLVEHWNGTSWKRVKSANPGGTAHSNALTGVVVTSKNNAWAVGLYSSGTIDRTLVEHWNGTSWNPVKSANPGGPAKSSFLISVDARPAGNVWAVGFSGSHAIALHWG